MMEAYVLGSNSYGSVKCQFFSRQTGQAALKSEGGLLTDKRCLAVDNRSWQLTPKLTLCQCAPYFTPPRLSHTPRITLQPHVRSRTEWNLSSSRG
jgi:hypothetical protein